MHHRLNSVIVSYNRGESNVLQYFGNVKHNLAALDTFAKLVVLVLHIDLRPGQTCHFKVMH